MIYNETLWQEWIELESQNYSYKKQKATGILVPHYLKKGYLHFDPRIWFPKRKDEIKRIVSVPEKVAKTGFHPFIKVVIKTPRYRYDEAHKDRNIEYKPRPICYASHRDALIYGFYSFCLTKKYEEYIHRHGINDCALAYRTDLDACNIDFAREVFEYVMEKRACTAICLDIKGFFDHINHASLREKWCDVMGVTELPEEQYRIFRSLTKFSYVNKNTLLKHFGVQLRKLPKQPQTLLELIPGRNDAEKFQTLRDAHIITRNPHDYGIPQGSPMSAVLSNIFMIDYDRAMMQAAKEHGFLYRRYCDDIIIVCDTEKADRINEIAYSEIDKYPPLKIQKKKEEEILFKANSKGVIRAFNAKKIREFSGEIETTNESKFYKNLQYLGFEFNGQQIYIRSSSLSRYFRRLKARVSKTVKMAYSPSGKGARIFKQKLYHRYTHLGKRNFIRYALNSASSTYTTQNGTVTRQGLNSPTIRRQIARHFTVLHNALNHKTERRIEYKAGNGKLNVIRN